MIKFFRKIRQNLLLEGNTRKYFKYAIGEIVLVVIGILIALAISNWNSNRIQNNRNKDLLIKLSKEMDQNIERSINLDTSKNAFSGRNKSFDSILKILNKGITVENLDFIINQPNYYTMTLNLNTIVFEELKNTGSIYSIGSDSLVSAIQRYYQLCERESFYNYEIGKSVINRREKCFEGFYSFQDFYLQDKEKAIADNDWIFNTHSQNYIYLKQYISQSNLHTRMMINKLKGITEESQILKQLIIEEIEQL